MHPHFRQYILVKVKCYVCLSHEIQSQDSADVCGHIVVYTQLQHKEKREMLRAHGATCTQWHLYTFCCCHVHCIYYWYKVMLNCGWSNKVLIIITENKVECDIAAEYGELLIAFFVKIVHYQNFVKANFYLNVQQGITFWSLQMWISLLCCYSAFTFSTNMLTFYKGTVCLCVWMNCGFCKCEFLYTLNII
jgi:hypothetical protein